jgi:hypothetical protein
MSAPGPPAGLVASSVSGNIVTLRWTPPQNSVPPTAYVLEGGTFPGQVLASLPTGDLVSTLTFAAPTGAFFIRMHAVAGALRSVASNEIQIFVNVAAPPSAPERRLAVIPAVGPPWFRKVRPVAIMAALAAACAPLYLTPTGPPETLAVLEGAEYPTGPSWGTPWLFQVGVVSILDVDGAQAHWRGGTQRLTLRAGRHAVTVQYERYPLRAAPAQLTFSAEAGRRYRVEAAERESDVVLWIVDAATGQAITARAAGGRLAPVR